MHACISMLIRSYLKQSLKCCQLGKMLLVLASHLYGRLRSESDPVDLHTFTYFICFAHEESLAEQIFPDHYKSLIKFDILL